MNPAPYRVLVTGSRTWKAHGIIHQALDALHNEHPDMVLVSGACPTGADAIAEHWARRRGVPVERHPADWQTHGRSAGPRRNIAMVQTKPDQVLAFIRGQSAGATQCVCAAEAIGIPVRKWTQ
jgi:Ni,Fe-hydrogenase III small subunit